MEAVVDNKTNISKANKSFRWTALAEIAAKLIAPIINMVLARFISPEVFGIVATLNVVTGLATTLSESGFARYVQQHQFDTKEEQVLSNKTSLTSSLALGLLLFSVIAIWHLPIGNLIGANGYEIYLIVAAGAIPFHSIISIETAILKRDFRFKITAIIRVLFTLVTAGVEITLGILGFGLVALTWGPLISSCVLSIALFFFLKEKNIFGFSFKHFKMSFTDNFLFIIESLCIWLVSALDILLLGNAFGESLVGIYKLAFNTEKGIIALMGSVFSPVLISLLSKFKQEDEQFKVVLIKYQKAVAFLGIPFGVGIFLFRDGLTNIFLGSAWAASIPIFGYFALVDSLKCSISDFISTLMISKGKPLGSILSQLIYLVPVCLCCVFAEKLGFDLFVILRACCTLVLIVSYSVLCKPFTGISPWKFYLNLIKPIICVLIMCLVAFPFSYVSSRIPMTLLGIAISIAIYFVSMKLFFPSESDNFFDILLDRGGAKTHTPKIFNKISTSFHNVFIKKTKKSINFEKGVLVVLIGASLTLSLSMFFSSNKYIKSISESFDLNETSIRKTSNQVVGVEYDTYNKNYESALEICSNFFSYSVTKTNWMNYYNFYVSDIKNTSFKMIYDDKAQFSTSIFSLSSMYIPSYNVVDNLYKFESAYLFSLFSPSKYISKMPFNASMYISMELADNLKSENESYESLIGKTIKYEGYTYYIANIISNKGWFYEELYRSNPYFTICNGRNILTNNVTANLMLKNQFFELREFLEMGMIQKKESLISEIKVKLLDGDNWVVDEIHTERAAEIYDMDKNSKMFKLDKYSIIGLITASILICFYFFILIYPLIFKKKDEVTFKFILFQIIMLICLNGLVTTGAFFVIGRYYKFMAFYGFAFGFISFVLSVMLPLIYLIVLKYLNTKISRESND